jgi:hypothetical protein
MAWILFVKETAITSGFLHLTDTGCFIAFLGPAPVPPFGALDLQNDYLTSQAQNQTPGVRWRSIARTLGPFPTTGLPCLCCVVLPVHDVP